MSAKKSTSLSHDEIVTGRKMSRRSVTLLGTVGVGSASALALLGASGCCFGGQTPGTGCSDQDPTDGLGRGTHCTSTGCSDNDPSDPMGGGRHCSATGCSDTDPTDPAGGGRNCGGMAPAPTPTAPPAPTAPPGGPAPTGGTTP